MRAVVVILFAALLLAGCSGGDDESAGTTQAETTANTESSTATTQSPETQEAADAFIVRVNEYIRYGQFRRAWLLLHPAQKKVVSATDLADCFGQTSEWPPNAKLKVTEAYAEPWDIPGGATNAPSTAVTIQVYVESSEEGNDVTSVVDTFTGHAFPVTRRIPSISGLGELQRWAWILAPRTFSGAKNGSC